MTHAVDLRPGTDGDRIAVIRDGEVSYLPATRVDIGAMHGGASGSCRYTRRSANGDLYVCGPGLDRTLFRSTDGGAAWSGRRYNLGVERFELRQMPRDVEHGWIGATTSLYKHVAVSESTDGGRTWVNERRVTDYEQCSGELTLLADGSTLVLTYDHRFHDRFSRAGVRARVSRDLGATWEPDEYVLGEGENYPGGVAMADGSLSTVCPYRDRGPIQAVRWRPASA